MASKAASRSLALVDTHTKNKALQGMAGALIEKKALIMKANLKDLKFAKSKKLSSALIDRLTLSSARVDAMARSLNEIAGLKDPIGDVIETIRRPNGLLIKKVRVPIGSILVIYESRPNVTSDCIGLCLKSGNSVILRGGREAINSNIAIFEVLNAEAKRCGIPDGAISIVRDTDRSIVWDLLKVSALIDLVIPRGGESLIREVTARSRIPVIKHYKGVCHTYVDASADLDMAGEICFNAKVQRPGVCNAMETLLVSEDIAKDFLPWMIDRFRHAGVQIRGCPKTRKIAGSVVRKAVESDWYKEYLDLILSVRVVRGVDEAITHIMKYGSYHSDAIDKFRAAKFLARVDSACVYVNASTRFTDGSEFGKGAEIGVSTDKIHARGPMGLEELTSYKYVIYGNGQVRR
ncbi:MAG: glutamate-5-semialdehyde dehydrogenase [Candidatus Omnitrophica bacterium]|nr:glutamate-5-semialdehyde dehydrogenase [Candidatus Omnitrophota bacterium]